MDMQAIAAMAGASFDEASFRRLCANCQVQPPPDFLARLVERGWLELQHHQYCWTGAHRHALGKAHAGELGQVPTKELYSDRSTWLALYTNRPELVRQHHGRSKESGWLDDLEWFASRQPALRKVLLQGLEPDCWLEGRFPPALMAYVPQEEELGSLLVAAHLARGEFERVPPLLKRWSGLIRSGWEAVYLFAIGEIEKAVNVLRTQIVRRSKYTTALPLIPSLFGQMAALRAGDHLLAGDNRLVHHHPLGQYLRWIAHRAAGSTSEFSYDPKFLQKAEGGLDYLIPWAMQSLGPLPQAFLDRRDEVRAALRAQELHGYADQLDDNGWGSGLQRQEPWEAWLSAFKVQGVGTPVKTPTRKAVAPESYQLEWHCLPEPQPRRRNLASGELTQPSWASLLRKPPDYLLDQDRLVLGKVRPDRKHQYVVGAAAARELVGHPHLFRSERPCALVECEQTLYVDKSEAGFTLSLVPPMARDQEILFEDLPSGEVGFYLRHPQEETLAPLLFSKMKVPLAAEAMLRDSLLPWQERIGLSYHPEVKPLATEIAGGLRVGLRCVPERLGLRLHWMVFPEGAPALPALQGPDVETVRWQGQLLRVRRDFAAERVAMEECRQRCAGLPAELDSQLGLEQALELLEQLQGMDIPMEWPEGRAWRVRPAARPQALRVQVSQERDWFGLQGRLSLDEGLMVELGRALELARTHPGRYLPLSDGDFLVLSEELRAQLEGLDQLSEEHGKSRRFSPLAATSVAGLELSQLKADQAFEATLVRFDEAARYVPALPPTLTAELRDYQLEGFQWMAQRLQAGAGACLADDMGLGKTLQVLALMLLRPGPHLVVCPTSVTLNWHQQIRQFAPTLQSVAYEGRERRELLSELSADQVVVVSYRTLLLDQLDETDWGLVVLDEAQTIKNPESKTAQACFALRARGRVATTGTPIENRLSELWSLFRFLNPSLLGTLPSFRRRFENPIAQGNGSARQRLKRLVGPFLLRRTKSQVLTELPPRTEIDLRVELSAGERALYEELRREAEATRSDPFQLLASLTRLRQACCHPRLLLPNSDLSSSKLEAFEGLVDDLRDGRHRALVFSQFTRLLDLLEERLIARGTSYLRLDGSTPVGERRSLVESFQAGGAELFLISLKAGGTGLNLTAADYVVHLDPWWNPAAEDQASDRAHRIGQTRPVTIYRLVAADTVEEKVLQMHGSKRQLAQQVLDGSQEISTLSAAELRGLLA
jgi:superfamily II DNA or RNA helicase